jgi:hypothetical protein
MKHTFEAHLTALPFIAELCLKYMSERPSDFDAQTAHAHAMNFVALEAQS